MPLPDQTFFTTKEQGFYDDVNTEIQNLVSPNAIYFKMDKSAVVRDPLYNEPLQRWERPTQFSIKAFIEGWGELREATDRGLDEVFEGRITMSRKHLDDAGIGKPKEGDVLQVWGQQWDIVLITEDGFIGDNRFPTQYICEVRRRTKFIPERRHPDV